jgi:hypothetical protein
MHVDVLTAVTIARPVAEVAAFAANPDNAPAWYVDIASVEWEGEPALRVGARMATRMTLRNRGEPRGFGRIVAPVMSFSVRRANIQDLARLKALLEGGRGR